MEFELALLMARCIVWIEVAVTQAQNLADYGTTDPTGGNGPQLFPVNHPLHPMAER